MPQDDINQTFKSDQFRVQNVVPADFKVVEFRGSDPTDLTRNPKRIWARTDTGELKYTVNGVDVTGLADAADLADKANQSDLDATNEIVSTKADQTDLDATNAQVATNTSKIASNTNAITANTTAINNIGNASPKGTYATLTALQTAFPSGTTGIYVVTADGKWYYWNGSAWTAGGVYQSTGVAAESINNVHLAPNAVSYDKTNFVAPGKNLFNKVTRTIGYYISETNGALVASVTYDTSDYIPVRASTTYAISKCRKVIVYDASKTFIAAQSFDVPAPGATRTVTPSQDGFLRISFYATDIGTSQVESGSSQTSYEDYNLFVTFLGMPDFSIKKEWLEQSVQDGLLSPSTLITEGQTDFFTLGNNRFNDETAVEGYQLGTDGKTLTANSTAGVSGYIYVADCTNLYFYRVDKVTRFSTILTGKFFFYDESLNLLSTQTTSSSSPKYATVPANTVYTRINYSLVPTYNIILVSGTDSDAIPYEEYQYLFDYADVTESVIAPITDYINGYSVSASGGVSTSAGFSITEFLPVKAGKTYYVSKFRHLMIYTSVVNPDTPTYINTYTTQYKFTAAYDGYIRMSIATTDASNWYFYEYTKKLMNFGDSIAHGDGNNYYGYGQMMAETFGMSILNYSLGGATLGFTTGRDFPYQNILNQVADAITANVAPDVILIDGGTNDSTYGVPLGTLISGYSTNSASYDTTTTLGAVEYIFMTLQSAFPEARIIFIKTHLMGSKPSQLVNIENAIHTACEKWAVTVANIMEESGFNTNLPVYAPYTQANDLTHPTDTGYRIFYNPIIKSSISKVMP